MQYFNVFNVFNVIVSSLSLDDFQSNVQVQEVNSNQVYCQNINEIGVSFFAG